MWKRLPEEPSMVAAGQKTFGKENYNFRAQPKYSGGIYCYVKSNPES